MKITNRIRGPRLGTKLLLLGMVLLIVPVWVSYRQLVGFERILIQGQSQVQLLTAESISTLFNGRDDLFSDLPVTLQDYESLYARPLPTAVRLDGRLADWGEIADKFQSFGFDDSGNPVDGAFELLLGERDGQLYVFMRIYDDTIILRDAGSLRLDTADHVRVRYIRTDGDDGRVTITFPERGVSTAYSMAPDWSFAANGTPENLVQGWMEPFDRGIQVEFRMPLDMLGSRRYFGLSFADADDATNREVREVTQTLPKAGKASFNLVVLRSPELLEIIQALGYSGSRILVIDGRSRVRAETGSSTHSERPGPEKRWTSASRGWSQYIRPFVHRVVMWQRWDPAGAVGSPDAPDQLIKASLAGDPGTLRRRLSDDEDIIMAAHPIVSKDRILGTIVVEQNIDEVLTFQRAALEETVVVSLTSLFVLFVVLLSFAGRLAWRIRHLRKEASAAIDQFGRLRTSALSREMTAGDEIGDLARSVSGMLSKLHQHNQFLENMPRTLRHEINNPLNTLSTSLQNLVEEHPQAAQSKYLESAKRGVTRIGSIVQSLADAANLDESLQSEELEIVDIQMLLENYVANCSVVHKFCRFVYRGTPHSVYARVSDYRIEQLLDKIIDNAIDFHRANSPIKVQLDTYRDFLRITVANRGPTLPASAESSLFDSMVSHRAASAQNQLHFGLGLYVVRVIAEHHGGSVRAMNLADGSGVAVMVQLPLAKPSVHTEGRAEPPLRALPN